MNYTYIDSEDKLSRYLKHLKDTKKDVIALDIECEFNLHQYGEKLCLIQVFDGTDSVIIDPFKTPIVQIKNFLENRSILKIVFDAPGDRAFLFKNYGIDLHSILDLQAAVGLLDFEKRDLGSVLKKALNIQGGTSKKKFQRYNWTRRPIANDAIKYALEDVLYLFELKDILLSEILAGNLLETFILKNLQAQNKPHIYTNKPRVFQSKKFRTLTRAQQQVFKQFYDIREQHAKTMNFSPNSVISNDCLLLVASEIAAIRETQFGKKTPETTKKAILAEMKKVAVDFSGTE